MLVELTSVLLEMCLEMMVLEVQNQNVYDPLLCDLPNTDAQYCIEKDYILENLLSSSCPLAVNQLQQLFQYNLLFGCCYIYVCCTRFTPSHNL